MLLQNFKATVFQRIQIEQVLDDFYSSDDERELVH